MALNIQYIQRDIADIKTNIKTISEQQETFMTRKEYESRHEQLEGKVDLLAKFVYMGLGAVTVIEVLLKFFWK
jgi:hypothetical protein